MLESRVRIPLDAQKKINNIHKNTEGWGSGLTQGPAKTPNAQKRFIGSNPIPSAKKK